MKDLERKDGWNIIEKFVELEKKMIKICILYCWSCMSNIVIISYIVIMIIDL